MSDPASLSHEGERVVPMRLQKFLARAGAASRRGSENLMTAGRVTVNGAVVTELGSKVDPRVDVVRVDGREVRLEDGATYLMLNKPAGYLCTMRDPRGRHTVAELVPCDEHPGLFCVGRLDQDTTGLLLFTTDGDAAQGLLHPSREKDKTYVALVEGRVGRREIRRLEEGVTLDDGPCAPASCRVLDERDPLVREVAPEGVGPYHDVVSLTIHEGRKHQVKRMLWEVGHEVVRLHRDAFGPLRLGGLPRGRWRELTADEVSAVRAAAGRGV